MRVTNTLSGSHVSDLFFSHSCQYLLKHYSYHLQTITDILHLATIFVLSHLWSLKYSFCGRHIRYCKFLWSVNLWDNNKIIIKLKMSVRLPLMLPLSQIMLEWIVQVGASPINRTWPYLAVFTVFYCLLEFCLRQFG